MSLSSQKSVSSTLNGLLWSTCSPSSMLLIQSPDQRIVRIYKAYWHGTLWKKTVNTMEENSDRTSWKSIRITPLKMLLLWKPSNQKTINSCWRKLCPNVVHDSIGIYDRASQRNHERDCEYGQKRGVWRVSNILKKKTCWRWVLLNQCQRTRRRHQEAVPGNKLTLDTWQKDSRY